MSDEALSAYLNAVADGDAGADRHPVLRDLDLDALERGTAEQHDRVEEWRLEAAREVL